MLSNLLKTSIGRLRIIAFVEGVSFLILLTNSIVKRNFSEFNEIGKWLGWIHGFLFVLFIIALLLVMVKHKWTIIQGAIAFIATLIPFGTFIWDAKMMREGK